MTQERGLTPIKAEKPAVQAVVLPLPMREEIERVKIGLAALYTAMEEIMQPGIDFDRVPGTDKPTLLQPGAQLLGQIFKMTSRFQVERADRDLDRNPPFVCYQVRCELYNKETGVFLGEGVGAANSLENKHRWRKAKGPDGEEIRVENEDIMTLDNTLLKMAKKRALVDATLNVTGASRLFTQDAEDLGIMEQVEPASSKQISFMRSLAKNQSMEEVDLLIMARKKVQREITKLEELTRPEASELINELKGRAPAGAASAGNDQSKGKADQAPAGVAPQGSLGSGAPAQGNGNTDGPTWDEFWKVIRGELKLSNAEAAKKLGRTDFKGLDPAGRKAVIDQLRAMAPEGHVA